MPAYPFRCLSCGKVFEKTISYKKYGKIPIFCPYCGESNVERQIVQVRLKTPSHQAQFSPADIANMETDPRAVGKAMRKMEEQSGESLAPEFHEVVDRLEKGQSYEQIEKELPEISDESGNNSHSP